MELNINNKTYQNFSEYLSSKEYNDHLDLVYKAKYEYALKAKEFFNQLEYDDKLLVFFHVMNSFYENEFEDEGSYRHLLYTKLGFDCDSYTIGMDCGCMELHNSIYPRAHLIESIKSIFQMLKIEPSNSLVLQALNCITYGSMPKNQNSYQLDFDFDS
jgi:hypothetical protein